MDEIYTPIFKAFRYGSVCFLVIILQYFILRQFDLTEFERFSTLYLNSFHQSRQALIQSQGLPLWMPSLFLGANFLSLQSNGSIYNPIFLLQMFFSDALLMDLVIPSLFLQGVLAGIALYSFLKETRWFSRTAIVSALAIYFFYGWYFIFLNNFLQPDLLIYFPFVLFGIECLFSRHSKRWLVLSAALMLTSYFTLALYLSPIFMFYWAARFIYLRKEGRAGFSQFRHLFFTLIGIYGISMVVVLPIILGGEPLRLVMGAPLSARGFLSGLNRLFLFPIHENYGGQLPFLTEGPGNLMLFQSVLSLLLMPQVVKNAPKNARFLLKWGLVLLGLLAVAVQAGDVMNLGGLVPVNLNLLALPFAFTQLLVIAHQIGGNMVLDVQTLKKTRFYYKGGIFALSSATLLYHYLVSPPQDFSLSLESLQREVIFLSPYLLTVLLVLIWMDLYYHLLRVITAEHLDLRRKSIFTLKVVEGSLVVLLYLLTQNRQAMPAENTFLEPNTIGSRSAAITDSLQVTGEEFHRVINHLQISGLEPFKAGYSSFAASSTHYFPEAFDWMLQPGADGIEGQDYFLMTALGARYLLTADSQTGMPGFTYHSRVLGVSVYQNDLFSGIGMTVQNYLPFSLFEELSPRQKRYAFMTTAILDDEVASGLAAAFRLRQLDLETIPDEPDIFDYTAAGRQRKDQSISLLHFQNNAFLHHYEAEAPSLIAYMIPFDRGWRALIDGQPAYLHRLPTGFMALEVPEGGDLDIVLYYRTPGLVPGVIISMTAGILVLGYYYKKREDRKGVIDHA